MAEVFFEDKPVEISEDKVVLDTQYDIRDDLLITKKSIEKTITSKIFYYDDLSAYLKFDDSGPQELMDLYFASSTIGGEKKILSTPVNSNLKLNRFDEKHFHAKIEDKENNSGNFVFATLTEKGVTLINLGYTELEHFEIVDDEFILINYYEKLDEKKTIWTSGVYNLNGKMKKSLFDRRLNASCDVQMVVECLPNGKRWVVVYLYQKGKKKRVAKFRLKDMKPVKKQVKKKKPTNSSKTTKSVNKKSEVAETNVETKSTKKSTSTKTKPKEKETVKDELLQDNELVAVEESVETVDEVVKDEVVNETNKVQEVDETYEEVEDVSDGELEETEEIDEELEETFDEEDLEEDDELELDEVDDEELDSDDELEEEIENSLVVEDEVENVEDDEEFNEIEEVELDDEDDEIENSPVEEINESSEQVEENVDESDTDEEDVKVEKDINQVESIDEVEEEIKTKLKEKIIKKSTNKSQKFSSKKKEEKEDSEIEEVVDENKE